jgi:hypothetical protein
MKLIRVLEYEADPEMLQMHLRNRGVKGHSPLWFHRNDLGSITIKERFVLPDPLPEWWDEVVPGVEERDPTIFEDSPGEAEDGLSAEQASAL